jgi:hypothetical protein
MYKLYIHNLFEYYYDDQVKDARAGVSRNGSGFSELDKRFRFVEETWGMTNTDYKEH